MNKHNELQLYLASGSPRRHELLTQLGYRFEVLRLDVPEQREAGEKPQDYVCRLARDKAMAGVAAAPTPATAAASCCGSRRKAKWPPCRCATRPSACRSA